MTRIKIFEITVKTADNNEIFSLNGKYKLWMFWQTIKGFFTRKRKLSFKDLKNAKEELKKQLNG